MRRDPDLIRDLLIYLEQNTGPLERAHSDLIDLPGRTKEEIIYHLQLLDDAGLVIALVKGTMQSTTVIVERLTWNGHEFLDAARDDKRWKQAKNTVLQVAGGFIYDLTLALLLDSIKGQLRLH